MDDKLILYQTIIFTDQILLNFYFQLENQKYQNFPTLLNDFEISNKGNTMAMIH